MAQASAPNGALAALRDAFNAVEVTPADGGPTVAELDRADDARLTAVEALEARQQRRPQDGPRCIWPRPAPRPPAGPPVEPPVTRVPDETWTQWEAARQQSVDQARKTRPADLAALAAKLTAAGLRPIVDHELALVRAECPGCRAGANDSLGLYRPLAVIPRRGRILTACDVCEVHHVR